MELENIILSEISQVQKCNIHMFSLMWNIKLTPIHPFLVKQVTLNGGHICEREDKRRKLRK
jgi:hypothetical protein